jgi:hypothetical protein
MKTEKEILALPWADRAPHQWCRSCKRTRAQVGTLYTVAVRWCNGLPPHMCDDCYGGDDNEAERRQLGIAALD